MKKSATESHRILLDVYGDHALAERTCKKWFARFKSGNFDLDDGERPGEPKKFQDEELETLLHADACQTQEELAKVLGVDQATVSRRLKLLGFIQPTIDIHDKAEYPWCQGYDMYLVGPKGCALL